MDLKPITDYLESKALGRQGTDIFINEMPNTCDNGILLLDEYHGTKVDQYLPDYYRAEFRVIVRHTDQLLGIKKARDCSKSLKLMSGINGSLLVRQVIALNLPRTYRKSPGGYFEFEVEMNIIFVELAA